MGFVEILKISGCFYKYLFFSTLHKIIIRYCLLQKVKVALLVSKSATFTMQYRHFWNAKMALLTRKKGIFDRRKGFKCKIRLIICCKSEYNLTFKNIRFSRLKNIFVLIFYHLSTQKNKKLSMKKQCSKRTNLTGMKTNGQTDRQKRSATSNPGLLDIPAYLFNFYLLLSNILSYICT